MAKQQKNKKNADISQDENLNPEKTGEENFVIGDQENLEEKVIIEDSKPEIITKEEPEPQVGYETFCAMAALKWTAKTRLEHYVQITGISKEHTVKEWEKILSQI